MTKNSFMCILKFFFSLRYLAVCKPVLAINWRKIASSRIILMIVWLISVLFMIPVILYSDLIEQPTKILRIDDIANYLNNKTINNHENEQNSSIEGKFILCQTKPTCTISWPDNHFINTEVAFIIYGFIIAFLIPVLLIITFYVLVVLRLRTSRFKITQQSSEKQRARRKVTILVLAVISVCLIAYTPYWIHQFIITAYYFNLNEAPSESFLLITTYLSTIFQVLLYANSALNPYLYAFLSEVFRESFKKVFQCHEVTVAAAFYGRIKVNKNLNEHQYSNILTNIINSKADFDKSKDDSNSNDARKSSIDNNDVIDEQIIELTRVRSKSLNASKPKRTESFKYFDEDAALNGANNGLTMKQSLKRKLSTKSFLEVPINFLKPNNSNSAMHLHSIEDFRSITAKSVEFEKNKNDVENEALKQESDQTSDMRINMNIDCETNDNQ